MGGSSQILKKEVFAGSPLSMHYSGVKAKTGWLTLILFYCEWNSNGIGQKSYHNLWTGQSISC